MRQGLDRKIVTQAACDLADEFGFEAVSLAMLAKKLDIRTPSLYNHIDNLNGLRQQMALHGLQQLYEQMRIGAVGKTGEDAFLSTAMQYVAYVRKHPGVYEAIMRVPDMVNPEMQKVSDAIIELLFLLLEPYQLEQKDAIHTVRGLRSLVHGFVSIELHRGFQIELDTDESLQHVLRTYLAGMRRFQCEREGTNS